MWFEAIDIPGQLFRFNCYRVSWVLLVGLAKLSNNIVNFIHISLQYCFHVIKCPFAVYAYATDV